MVDERRQTPTVTVIDPTHPDAAVVDVLPIARQLHPWSRRTRLAVAAVAVLLLATAITVHAIRERTRSQVAAESALMRFQVISASVDGSAQGRPGSPVQDAVVDLTVRNNSPVVVRVVRQLLDGGDPADPGPRVNVAPGSTTVLTVRWRVLCAEVGELQGPRVLTLRVRAPHAQHLVRIPLIAAGVPASPVRAFRAAVDRACAVLLPGGAS